MSDVYTDLGVTPLINAAGKLTAFGGSAQVEAVAKAQADAARAHVDLQQLRDAVGARIAALAGAERASVTPGAGAGIAIAVAACIAGRDLARVQRLPDSDGLANGVLLQAGHDIDFGAPVTQMIRLGGGRACIVGSRTAVTLEDLERALEARSTFAAFLFVQSHHCLQTGRLSLAVCITRCRRVDLPVIVDAAAEEDLRRYVALGADLVTYSGGKAFGGPTSGFIAGRADLVDACELQQRGIARAMKVGKETLAGLAVALDAYAARDPADEAHRRADVLRVLETGLARVPGIVAARHVDEAGRGIERVALRWPAGDLAALVRRLAEGNPSIRTRNHHLKEGFVLLDPRELDRRQAETIVARIAEAVCR
jgi:L-seryl-tRNA(Ser) seleniumtransferase/D-glucosaminate-6-phosphate ammonia-lyase